MMLDPGLTLAYVVVAAALALAPGPDVMFVIANGMRHRARGAVAAALGTGCGTLVHACAAALGVSAVVAASPAAFAALQYAGAAYLFYLGVQTLRACLAAPAQVRGQAPVPLSANAVFRRGMLTNLLNPKVGVFYLALLPQFVNVDLGHVGLQIFLLGSIHNAFGVAVLLCFGIGAGRASDWLARSGFARWLDGIAGLFFITLAVRLALSERAAP